PPLFFFTTTAPPGIYTLSLHDALPILGVHAVRHQRLHSHLDVEPELLVDLGANAARRARQTKESADAAASHAIRARGLPGIEHRSEEHTSELQSRGHLVCRLLLEKKKK